MKFKTISLPPFGGSLIRRIIGGESATFIPKTPDCIRVVTLNVHFGKDTDKIAQSLKGNPNLAEADIIMLQEIEAHRSEGAVRAARIARALKFKFVYAPARDIFLKRGTHGLAILSRKPLRKVRIIKLPLYKLLLRSRPRIALAATAILHGKKIKLYNVHLDTTLNLNERVAQVQKVLGELDQAETDPVVLGGDFNMIPLLLVGRGVPVFYSNQKKKFHAFLRKQGFETKCETSGYTLRRGMVRFQLDGVYTKNASIIQSRVERSVRVSDHFPLWADILVG